MTAQFRFDVGIFSKEDDTNEIKGQTCKFPIDYHQFSYTYIGTYSQLLFYRTLGYTGIRAHTGPPRISVPRRNSSQYVLYSPKYSDIPDFLYTGL